MPMIISYFFFSFFSIALALLAPIPFLVMGLVFPHSEKRGYPRYWYAVAIAAVVWFLASAALVTILFL